jgi:hypothetical protein
MQRLDGLIFGAISNSETTPWANDTHYLVGITVLDTDDASVWMNAIEHVSPTTGTFADARTAYPDDWVRLLTGFAPRGEWAHSTQYFPYDLAYQSALGIFALCTVKHISNPSGSIKDDAIYWAFLCDLSSANLATAVTVSYSNVASPALTATNVQMAIDQVEQQIISLNDVNTWQGENIGDVPQTGGHPTKSLQTQINDLATRATALEIGTMKLAGNQTIAGGFRVTAFNIGTAAGTVTPDPMKGNYQYLANSAAFTLSAPIADCAIDILITNGSGAGAIAFAGFTTGAVVGDALDTVVGHKFVVSIRRINSTATYAVKALQ